MSFLATARNLHIDWSVEPFSGKMMFFRKNLKTEKKKKVTQIFLKT
jgi:hypothetical protein